MTRYVLRPRAKEDLADIWRYTSERWSIEQADRYYRALVAEFVKLAEQPSLGRACEEVLPGYRRQNVKAHVIFFRVEGAEIDIVRILHARRDFRRHVPSS